MTAPKSSDVVPGFFFVTCLRPHATMHTMKRFSLLAILGVVCFDSTVQGADIVPDIDKVKGIESYRGPDAGKALLAKNGFVVVPHYYHQIFSPYYKSPLPRFVTADSVHRTFHVIFEEQLKKVETVFVRDLAVMTEAMIADLSKELTGKDAAAPALKYLRVAQSLLDSAATDTADKTVAAELALITRAEGISVSPLLEYAIDYSQFKPRGFYTETATLSRYFMAMSWYGNAALRLKSDQETRMAVLLSSALTKNREASARWRKVDRTYTYLIAEPDDLTPVEYAAAVQDIRHDAGSPEFLEAFRKQAEGMRAPRINSMILSPAEMGDWVRHSKGMRLFGKRYVPDSEIFMTLTAPKVPGRGFPSGLDVMVANGSRRAQELMAARPDVKMSGYTEGMTNAVQILTRLKAEKQPSHYVELLKVAETLTSEPVNKAAPFAKTTAYADKSIMTALSSWASLRHAWVLHAKQSAICLGMAPSNPMPGYVEPNPAFFEAMQRVNKRSIKIFGAVQGGEVGRFRKFDELLASLSEMLRKQFAGEKFTQEEISLFDNYANAIGDLQGFRFNMDADKQFPWMALVCDVHTEAMTRQCLEVGTGGAMPIYVVVEQDGVPYLLKGGVYSYFEFAQPIGNRLTDEEWRSWWDAGKMPRMPPWTSSFVVGLDVDSLIRNARNGQIAEQLLYVDDPKIDEFLEQAMKPDGNMGDNKTYRGILYVAAHKLQGEAAPILLGLLQNGELGKEHSREVGVATFAAEVLPFALRRKDLPALLKIALGEDKRRAELAVRAGNSTDGEVKVEFLGEYLTEVPENKLSRTCLDWLDYSPVSKDITGCLLKCYNGTKEEFRKRLVVEVLAKVWSRFGLMEIAPQPAPRTSVLQQEQWEKDLRCIALETLRGDDKALWRDAMRLAGALRINEAVPEIAKRVTVAKFEKAKKGKEAFGGGCVSSGPQEEDPDSYPTDAPQALAQIGNDAAVDVLIRLTYVKSTYKKREILKALKYAESERSVPRLTELLNDEAEVHISDYRVCDQVAEALAAIYPDGPAVNTDEDSRAERNRKIAELKKFLQKRRQKD